MSEIIVLKCGGSTIDALSESFFTNIKTLQESGQQPIIVHGGGPAIKEMLTKLQIESEFVNGLRKTTADVMDVVEMVLTGVVNNSIVQRLQDAGIQAVGLTGSDGNLLTAKAIDFEALGYVGEVTNVQTELIQQLLANNIIPVIAPIGRGTDGTRYNINADTAAGAIATAVAAKQLVFVTDVPGILKENVLLTSVTEAEVIKLIDNGVIYGGMIPKVEAALASLGGELQEAMIVDGNQSVLSAAESTLVGTVIRKSVGVV